jgi:hypothetical protein
LEKGLICAQCKNVGMKYTWSISVDELNQSNEQINGNRMFRSLDAPNYSRSTELIDHPSKYIDIIKAMCERSFELKKIDYIFVSLFLCIDSVI